jgi:uncharacterized membrane protein
MSQDNEKFSYEVEKITLLNGRVCCSFFVFEKTDISTNKFLVAYFCPVDDFSEQYSLVLSPHTSNEVVHIYLTYAKAFSLAVVYSLEVIERFKKRIFRENERINK